METASRTADETERMLCLAHALCLHWESTGTPANEQRGLVLGPERAQLEVVVGEGHSAHPSRARRACG